MLEPSCQEAIRQVRLVVFSLLSTASYSLRRILAVENRDEGWEVYEEESQEFMIDFYSEVQSNMFPGHNVHT